MCFFSDAAGGDGRDKDDAAGLKEFAFQFVFYNSHINISVNISVCDNQVVPGNNSRRLVDFHLSLMPQHVLPVMGHSAVFRIKNLCIPDAYSCKLQSKSIRANVQNRVLAEREV